MLSSFAFDYLNMKKIYKEHIVFLAVFVSMLFVFMGRMIFLREAFIVGDNLSQGLPWLKVYADALKNLHFPFWVTDIQCGFPMIAEGQVGGFYPLNLLMFFTLPFKLSYNFLILFHFMLTGVSVYFLARKLGADLAGGIVAAIVLCYGSAYANIGYHLGMIRSLSWFPLGILLIEHYFQKENKTAFFLLSLVMCFQILSGSIQTAVYSFLFYFIYIVQGLKVHKLYFKKGVIRFFCFSLIPIICFMPQLLLTLSVVKNSARIASLDFALWGSLNPISILTVYFPSIFNFKGQISTEDFYLGSLTVLFVIAAIKTLKQNKTLVPVFTVGCVAVFFALGWFNPIYIILLKVFKFYTFRAPVRFVFFSIFSASVLAGVGFTAFFNQRFAIRKDFIRTFFISIIVVLGFVVSSALIIIFAKDAIIRIGQVFVEKFIAGTPYHRYDIYDYYEKVDMVYNMFFKSVLFSGKRMLCSFIFTLLSVSFCYTLIYRKLSFSRKKIRVIAMTSGIVLIVLNLWAYRYYPGGYKENVQDFKVLEVSNSRIFNIVKDEGKDFRIMPFDIRSSEMPIWAVPNVNMYFDINSIGAYSPLAFKKYYDFFEDFQIVDDSIGLKKPLISAFSETNIELLRMLNVRFILSPRKITNAKIIERVEEEGLYLYEVKNPFNKGFFSSNLKGVDVWRGEIEEIAYQSGYAVFKAEVNKRAYFIFSEVLFPGWEVFVNGEKRDLVSFKGLFQAVKVEPGVNEIVFKYKLRSY